jgi:hypothetical protein
MKKEKSFGSSKAFGGGKDISFPKHLTPEIIHSALFVFNAPKEEIAQRVQYCAKQIGDEAMSYAMALLVLPTLMDNMRDSEEYKQWQESKKKTIN